MEITLEEIQKKFEGLPEDLKWAIMAANVDENIIGIGQAQSLNIEQMGKLSLETHKVMLGFTPPDKFEEAIKNIMKLGDEKTRAVVSAVNEKILKEIRSKMPGNPSNMPKVGGLPSDTEEEKKNNAQILNSAGIEIIPAKNASEEKFKKDIDSILTQKLSASVQNPMARTEHTLDNITKNPSTSPVAPKVPTSPSSIVGTIKPPSMDTMKTSPSYTKGADPYRMKPE